VMSASGLSFSLIVVLMTVIRTNGTFVYFTGCFRFNATVRIIVL
jgi:hypothetical protein